MQRPCHAYRSKKSVRLSPSVEALECRKLLSGLGPGAPPMTGDGVVWPTGVIELIKAHKVVAFRAQFAVGVSLPPTGNIQQYSLEIRGGVRLHRHAHGPQFVSLASATVDQADRTLTLTPTAPAPVGVYRLEKQGSSDAADPLGAQVKWQVMRRTTQPPPRSKGSSDWYNSINPLNPLFSLCLL